MGSFVQTLPKPQKMCLFYFLLKNSWYNLPWQNTKVFICESEITTKNILKITPLLQNHFTFEMIFMSEFVINPFLCLNLLLIHFYV